MESSDRVAGKSEVEIRAEKLGKINIWADWWGRKQKEFDH